MKTRPLLAAGFALLLLPLAGSQCEDMMHSGEDMVETASDELDSAVDDTGGWAGRTVDTTKNRAGNSVNRGMNRIEAAADTK